MFSGQKIASDGLAAVATATKVSSNKENRKVGGHSFASIGAGETLANNDPFNRAHATTVQDEAPARSFIDPVAERVLEKTMSHYKKLFDLVTQMQRDRLQLGPEVSDFEVMARANASYHPFDQAAASLVQINDRLDKIEAIMSAFNFGATSDNDTKLAIARAQQFYDDLLQGQLAGKPYTLFGNSELSQQAIGTMIEQMELLCGPPSAPTGKDGASKAAKGKGKKPFVVTQVPEDLKKAFLNNAQAKPGTGATKYRKCKSRMQVPPTFTAAEEALLFADGSPWLDELEKELEKNAFTDGPPTRGPPARGPPIRPPRDSPLDFTQQFDEIERESAELRKFPAQAPSNLVPESVDNADDGIRVFGSTFFGNPANRYVFGEEQAESSASAAGKYMSRAEERRVGRERAKAMRKEAKN